MMVIHLVQDAATIFTHTSHWIEGLQIVQAQAVHAQAAHTPFLLHWQLPPDLLVLDKPIEQTDLVGDIQKWFNNFVKTGQAWAFVTGLVAGYLIKTFTSFG